MLLKLPSPAKKHSSPLILKQSRFVGGRIFLVCLFITLDQVGQVILDTGQPSRIRAFRKYKNSPEDLISLKKFFGLHSNRKSKDLKSLVQDMQFCQVWVRQFVSLVYIHKNIMFKADFSGLQNLIIVVICHLNMSTFQHYITFMLLYVFEGNVFLTKFDYLTPIKNLYVNQFISLIWRLVYSPVNSLISEHKYTYLLIQYIECDPTLELC